MDFHEYVQSLRSLAIELGKTPTAREFFRHVRGAEHAIKSKRIDSYIALVHAAGLEPSRFNSSKISNDVFKRSIDAHLESYEPKEVKPRQPLPSMAVISDIHWPFASQRVIDQFYEYVKDHQPEYVIINGDAWDMYSHSKFPRSHNVFTPREEQAKARASNEEFWVKVQKLSPASKCYQMMGNHDVRPLKRVLEEYPEAEDWITEKLKSIFTFQNVTSIMDAREELEISGILIFHGYRSKLGDHRDYTLYSTINGHTHNGGCVFRQIRGQTLFEMNCGYAGSPDSKGLSYTPQKIVSWTPGFGVVNKHGPQFISV